MIDLFCSREHYARHAYPVWAALPDDVRGEAYAPKSGSWWATASLPVRKRLRPLQAVLVASYVDAREYAHHPVILVEHGAGQSYPGDLLSEGNGSYSGGAGLGNVILFICPNDDVAERWQGRYPTTRTAVVGDPFLDPWLLKKQSGFDPFKRRRVVALSWHWDANVIPEMRWAFPHYVDALPGLAAWAAANDVSLLGHAHPRAWASVRRAYDECGIEPVEDYLAVLDRADVLVADNTSALWEFCALDRPVVILDAPWYRRDVAHGLRFWTHADAGVRISEPGDLIGAVEQALDDPRWIADARNRAAHAIYRYRDGSSTQRAASAVLGVAR